MSIQEPVVTFNYSEPFSPTFEREFSGKELQGNAWLDQIEKEIEQETQQLDSMIEKLLNFEENDIAPPIGQPKTFTRHSVAKVEKPAPSSTYSSSSPPLVKGQYTDADLGTLPPSLQPFREDILVAANKSGVPPNILAAQIYQESRGQIHAGSTNQATGLTDAGLMQVDPATFQALRAKHADLGPNLSDPATNILAGAYYDEDMMSEYGSIPLMLRAYNSGPNGVDRSNANAIPAGVGDPNYVKLVMQYADDIQAGRPLPA
jgi:soluble lytic murein transglycosylase-like protein